MQDSLLGLYIHNYSMDTDTIRNFLNAVRRYSTNLDDFSETRFLHDQLENFFKYENEDAIFVYYLDRKHTYDVYDILDLDAKIILTHPQFKDAEEVGDKLWNTTSTLDLGEKNYDPIAEKTHTLLNKVVDAITNSDYHRSCTSNMISCSNTEKENDKFLEDIVNKTLYVLNKAMDVVIENMDNNY